jgi:hypothetical protein
MLLITIIKHLKHIDVKYIEDVNDINASIESCHMIDDSNKIVQFVILFFGITTIITSMCVFVCLIRDHIKHFNSETNKYNSL